MRLAAGFNSTAFLFSLVEIFKEVAEGAVF